jgi:UrcA family protein
MSIRFTFAIAALAIGTAPAFAASDPVTAEIAVADLDLSNPQDQARLDRRVESAARQICHSGLRASAARAGELRCIETVLASAKPQVEMALANARKEVRIANIRVSQDG